MNETEVTLKVSVDMGALDHVTLKEGYAAMVLVEPMVLDKEDGYFDEDGFVPLYLRMEGNAKDGYTPIWVEDRTHAHVFPDAAAARAQASKSTEFDIIIKRIKVSVEEEDVREACTTLEAESVTALIRLFQRMSTEYKRVTELYIGEALHGVKVNSEMRKLDKELMEWRYALDNILDLKV